MNNFKEILFESEPNYTVRPNGEKTSPNYNIPAEFKVKQSEIIGWVNNKHNVAGGWTLTKLDAADQKEFNPSGAKGIYRSYTEKGTNIVKLDATKGKFAFIDNEKYLEGVMKFERMTKYKSLVIDSGCEKYFV